MSGCNAEGRKKLYEFYDDEANYTTVSGVIGRCHFYDDGGAWWPIEFDENCITQLGEDVKLWGGFDAEGHVGGGFDIVPQNQEILSENNFYDLFTELVSDPYTDSVFEHIVKITTSPKIWWDGWAYPIIQVQVDETIYLDHETGKANFLRWIQNDLQ